MKRALALAMIALALGPACARQNERKDELSAALYRTETKPRTFTYTEQTPFPRKAVILGRIADDYRYRADAEISGALSVSEVVVDDARAVKASKGYFQDTLNLPSGRWVIDPHGANNLFAAQPTSGAPRPDDPIFDALDLLRYVRRAMGEASGVLIFNPESQDYRPKFDPFPPPDDGVKRYDLVTPTLSVRDPTTDAGRARQIPGARYFRRLAVYVEGDIVRDVRERISVADTLEDPRSRIAARIGDYGIDLPDGDTDEQAAHVVRSINALAQQLSQPGVRERDLHVRFSYPRARMDIRLPNEAQRVKLSTSTFSTFFPNTQVLYATPG